MLKEFLKAITKKNTLNNASFTLFGYSEPKLTDKIKAEISKPTK